MARAHSLLAQPILPGFACPHPGPRPLVYFSPHFLVEHCSDCSSIVVTHPEGPAE